MTAPLDVWRFLPVEAQCHDCRAWRHPAPSASLHEILSASLFCGAIAGVLDSTLSKLLADYCAGDEDSLLVLLDLAETRGMHEPGYKWPAREPREWQRIERHEHVWLMWERGGEDRLAQLVDHRGLTRAAYVVTERTAVVLGHATPTLKWGCDKSGRRVMTIRRCTCGVFEHEHEAGRVTHTTGPWSDAELAMINVFD